MTDWDVIVIGAGPAGAALAYALALERRVLLLERQAAPGKTSPRIGESLPGAARVLLTRLGVFERFLADAHVERGATVSAWHGDEPVWFDSLRDPNGPGWHLDRLRFDASLRQAACESGAVLRAGCGPLRVERKTDHVFVVTNGRGETHRAAILVDASGRSATAARQLGVERRALDELICLYAHLPAEVADEDDCTRICADRNGWWYSVRVPSGQRVLAFHLDADDPALKSLRDPSQLLTKARAQPLLVEALTYAASATVHARVASSAMLDLEALGAVPGFFAVGDASLSFDPIASQGLFHALASALSAAEAIRRSQHDPSSQATFIAELSAVCARYREELHAVYTSVSSRHSGAFWARRSLDANNQSSSLARGRFVA